MNRFSRLLFLAAAVLAPALLVSSCSRTPRPNVLLIVLDTLRGDRLSCYGYARDTTPHIDALAAQGTLYAKTFSTCFWTLPAHASLFTGIHPLQAGATSETLHLPDDNTTLAEVLSAAGYHTAAFVCNSWVSKERGFAQGFSEYYEMWRAENQSPRTSMDQTLESMTVDRVAPWIDRTARQKQPFFLFLNLNGVHLPYDPPGEYATRFLRDTSDPERVHRDMQITSCWDHLTGGLPLDEEDYRIMNDLYDGEVAFADVQVGRLVEALRKSGALDNTIVIVTADHGENLGERDRIDHMMTLYDATTHIPLVIRYPRVFAAGKRIDDLTSIIDIAPTVIDLCGADKGVDYLHVKTTSLANPERKPRAFVVAGNERPVTGVQLLQKRYPGYDWKAIDYRLRSLRTPVYKLIENEGRSVELYDVARDPAESTDLTGSQPDVQKRLLGALTRSFEAMGTSRDKLMFESTDQESLDRLRALGYIN
jgi:arylsulfatase A-like enzyme